MRFQISVTLRLVCDPAAMQSSITGGEEREDHHRTQRALHSPLAFLQRRRRNSLGGGAAGAPGTGGNSGMSRAATFQASRLGQSSPVNLTRARRQLSIDIPDAHPSTPTHTSNTQAPAPVAIPTATAAGGTISAAREAASAAAAAGPSRVVAAAHAGAGPRAVPMSASGRAQSAALSALETLQVRENLEMLWGQMSNWCIKGEEEMFTESANAAGDVLFLLRCMMEPAMVCCCWSAVGHPHQVSQAPVLTGGVKPCRRRWNYTVCYLPRPSCRSSPRLLRHLKSSQPLP
jgi:hypothetical protein